jgi:hypothetical protein
MIKAVLTSRLRELQNTLGWILLMQVALLILTSLLLDGGYCSRIFGCAMVGYWLMVGWLAFRRRNALTKTDAVLIRSGPFIWLAIAVLVQIALECFSHA